ncbi:nuclear transport factor 2 family protein [Shewanella atlantica]|uniref:Nuclear transport factor 2 family protein n=1 Tax=Shewanella atlantica TaxID=271099 RepID=A0A3S0IHT9_9GAMM|nr:nuclear transport factor 2 family protein [Shewanella atlantica]RTR34369.1 nuclear transport factor 2 family protein [Shewanella atlantica]
MNIDDLRSYCDAWNAHDIDKIMAFMSQECVFETGGGAEKFGTRYTGYTQVKSRFMSVWHDFPDVRFENSSHFVAADRGCSEWTFVATKSDGSLIEVDGCDLFTFQNGKIAVKRTFLKNRK